MITKAKIESLKSARPGRFLVVKFGSLGDIVHCLPSVAQLRRAFPQAEIDWLIERKNRIVVDLSGLEVRLIPIDTYQWRNSPGIGSAKEIGEFVWALRTDGYDCAIDFQGLLKSAFFAYLSGAPVRIGWERDFLRKSVANKLKGVKDYVVINPGGNWVTKNWHPERYGELAGRLMRDGLPVAVTWGPGEEDMVRTILRT